MRRLGTSAAAEVPVNCPMLVATAALLLRSGDVGVSLTANSLSFSVPLSGCVSLRRLNS